MADITGLQGFRAPSDLELEYNTLVSRGYPFPNVYSSIIEMHEAYGTKYIHTDMDIENGQSGSAVNFSGYTNTTIGIVSGEIEGLLRNRNFIVRLTNDLCSYLSELRAKQ